MPHNAPNKRLTAKDYPIAENRPDAVTGNRGKPLAIPDNEGRAEWRCHHG